MSEVDSRGRVETSFVRPFGGLSDADDLRRMVATYAELPMRLKAWCNTASRLYGMVACREAIVRAALAIHHEHYDEYARTIKGWQASKAALAKYGPGRMI